MALPISAAIGVAGPIGAGEAIGGTGKQEGTVMDGIDEPKRDFTKMFDLDRSTLIKSMVDRMEECIQGRHRSAGRP